MHANAQSRESRHLDITVDEVLVVEVGEGACYVIEDAFEPEVWYAQLLFIHVDNVVHEVALIAVLHHDVNMAIHLVTSHAITEAHGAAHSRVTWRAF